MCRVHAVIANFTRLLVLLFAFWLPLQAATVAAMPVCGERDSQTLDAPRHAHDVAQHGDVDAAPYEAACDQCAVCHAVCMGTLPLARVSWSHEGSDGASHVARATQAGVIPPLFDRPPLDPAA